MTAFTASHENGRHKVLVFLFFALYLFLGLLVHRNYGMSWDDAPIREYGVITYDYLMKGDRTLYDNPGRYHGTAYETPLVFLEHLLRLEDPRDVHWMRHGMTFLVFFVSVYFFYLLCRNRFRSRLWGLLGALFLIVSPRIFADSFYNTKDIPCLSFFIFSIFTLIRYLERRSWSWAVLHAVVCAFSIDIRILGVLVPCLTVFFVLLDLMVRSEVRREAGKTLLNTLIFLASLAGFTVLFWPVLWEDPLGQFVRAFLQMSRYNWNNQILYLGEYMMARDVPWHYVPVWIAITTPLIYSLFFLIGSFSAFWGFFRSPLRYAREHREDLLFLAWFFTPILAVIVLNSILYDAWRQMFYVYPAFVILALIGIQKTYQLIRSSFAGLSARTVQIALALFVAAGLAAPLKFMVQYHPYQNVYFNGLAGGMVKAKHNFDMDYWALSYKEGLEWILKNDPSESIPVAFHRRGGGRSFRLIDPKDRRRLVLVEDPQEAKYFVSNYRWHRDDYPYPNEVYSRKIGGAKIMVVHRMV